MLKSFERSAASCLLMLTILAASSGRAATLQVNEDFETNPLWSAVGNTQTNNNFGYRASGNVNGSTGELGETFGRTDAIASYADISGTVTAPLTLKDPWSASADLKITSLSGHGRFILGWFTSAAETDANAAVTNGGLPSPILGVRFTRQSGTALELNLRSLTAGGSSSQDLVATAASLGVSTTVYSLTMTYTPGPDANLDNVPDNGTLAATLDNPSTGGIDFSTSVNVSTGSGAHLVNFDRFGIRSRVESGQNQGTSTIYFDNLKYTVGAVPEPASVALLAPVGALALMRARRRRSHA